MFRKLVLPLVVLAAAAGLISAFSGCTGKSDVSGTWSGRMTLAEGGKPVTDLEFSLVQKSGEITGFMNLTKLEGGKTALKGTRTGDEIKFTTEYKKGMVMSFTGAVKSKYLIQGSARISYFDPQVPVKEDNVTLEMMRK